jgi:polyhydroxyalkanoate synthesis regulator phasin
MPENDVLKRYLDAGMAFTQLTRARANEIVKDLVKQGELRREQAQERVDDLVERSRQNTEMLLALVRKEIANQLSAIGVATKDDLKRLEAKLGGAKKAAPAKKAVKKAAKQA